MGDIIDFYSRNIKQDNKKTLTQDEFLIRVSHRLKDSVESQVSEDLAKMIFQYTLDLYK